MIYCFRSAIFLFYFFILAFSCSKSSTDPPPPPQIEPDTTSHNFTWEIDTLHAPDALQVFIRNVWGTDENNVWVAGHSDTKKYQLWHWDGSEWENQALSFPGYPHSLDDIYGFSEDDIWIVGEDLIGFNSPVTRNFIIHYTGNSWEHISGLDAPLCLSVWGSADRQLFVGCDSGVVLHHDGNQWKKQQIDPLPQIVSIDGVSATEVYAIGIKFDQTMLPIADYYFFKYDGTQWSLVDSTNSISPDFGTNLWNDGEEKLYSGGLDGLYEWQNNTWNRVNYPVTPWAHIHGSADNNIFAGGLNAGIFHYNGNSWHHFSNLTNNNRHVVDVWTFKDHVFLVMGEGSQSLVYRGTRID